MPRRQLRWHLIDKRKSVYTWVDGRQRLRAENTSCGTVTYPDYIETLDVFLETVTKGLPTCRMCYRRAKVLDVRQKLENISVIPGVEDTEQPGTCRVCRGELIPGAAVEKMVQTTYLGATYTLVRCDARSKKAIHADCASRAVPPLAFVVMR